MSKWNKATKDDIEIDGDEINIYAGYDERGSVYAVVKVKDMKEILKQNEPTRNANP